MHGRILLKSSYSEFALIWHDNSKIFKYFMINAAKKEAVEWM